MQWQWIYSKIPHVPLHFQILSGTLSGRKDEPLGTISSQLSASIPSTCCRGYARCVRVHYLKNCLTPLLMVRRCCSCWEWCWLLNQMAPEAAAVLLSFITLLYSTPTFFFLLLPCPSGWSLSTAAFLIWDSLFFHSVFTDYSSLYIACFMSHFAYLPAPAWCAIHLCLVQRQLPIFYYCFFFLPRTLPNASILH